MEIVKSYNLARCDHLDFFSSTYSLPFFSHHEQSIHYHVVYVQSNSVTILADAVLLDMIRVRPYRSLVVSSTWVNYQVELVLCNHHPINMGPRTNTCVAGLTQPAAWMQA